MTRGLVIRSFDPPIYRVNGCQNTPNLLAISKIDPDCPWNFDKSLMGHSFVAFPRMRGVPFFALTAGVLFRSTRLAFSNLRIHNTGYDIVTPVVVFGR